MVIEPLSPHIKMLFKLGSFTPQTPGLLRRAVGGGGEKRGGKFFLLGLLPYMVILLYILLHATKTLI
jgi:hypothetical protein